MKLEVFVGQKFNHLTVLFECRVPNTPAQTKRGRTAGNRAATCVCDCGNEVVVRLHHLVHGVQISCGCQGIQRRSLARSGIPSDSRTKHPLYPTHGQMMKRCHQETHPAYPNYGGRGIRVTDEWHDVVKFCSDLDKLLGPRPTGYTLDRIDNSGNYEPGNVRWADGKTQAANRRSIKR